MKAIYTVMLGLAIHWGASAQQVETLFGKGGPKVRGAYGSASQKFSSIDGQFANFLGGYGGVLFTNNVMIGAGAYALLNGNSIDIEGDRNTARHITYVGLVAEKVFRSEKAFHVYTKLLTGAAFIGEQNLLPDGGQYTISSRGAFVVEPELAAELNLTKWFRMSGGLSYRLVASESVYSAPAATVSLKFGKF